MLNCHHKTILERILFLKLKKNLKNYNYFLKNNKRYVIEAVCDNGDEIGAIVDGYRSHWLANSVQLIVVYGKYLKFFFCCVCLKAWAVCVKDYHVSDKRLLSLDVGDIVCIVDRTSSEW